MTSVTTKTLGLPMRKVMTIPAVAAVLCMLAAGSGQGRSSVIDRPIIMAQGGFTFGSRDDLGPRYDAYSERWDQYKPTDPYVCRWETVRTPLPDGRVVPRRQRLCGFKVPARD
jgi:hypothetical protein